MFYIEFIITEWESSTYVQDDTGVQIYAHHEEPSDKSKKAHAS